MIDFLSWLWVAVGWSVVWQSTLALAAGLLAAAICKRRPARADGLLVASVVAALAAPAGTFLVHELGWGMFLPRQAPTAAISLIDREEPKAMAPLAPLDDAPAPAAASAVQIAAGDDPIAAGTTSPFAPRKDALSRSERRPNAPPSQAWATYLPPTLLAVWLVMSATALARLGAAVWTGRRLLASSYSLHNARIDRALASAAERLGLHVKVEARISTGVRCPVIWCWPPRAVILLPVEFASATDESAWLGIFCHELAHWKRRDHLSSLAVDLLRCVVPWQPLAWWAARRHAQLSELACDEWVLACGQSAENYADSLLDLTPQRGAALALAVVRNRAGLVGRIRHILAIAQARPALGRNWTVAVAGSTFALIALVALAQQQRPRAKNASSTDAPGDVAKALQTDAAQLNDPSQQISGVVLDLADKPAAGARVYWVGLARAEWNTLPHDDPRNGKLDLLAEGLTDEQGRFTMSAAFEIQAYQVPSVFVRHRAYGLGLRSYMFGEHVEPLEIHLPKATPIRGRILNSNGMPVAMAEVFPVHVESLVRGSWEGSVPLSDALQRSGDLPSFWPQPVKTDADGRFSITGNDNAGTTLLRIAADGFGDHGITVTDDEAAAEWNKEKPGGRRSPAVANNFTLVLEPAREVEGIVTDAKTGHPVTGAEIILESSLNSGHLWNRRVARATSDAQGHYRFVVPATGDEQHFRIYPPLGYSPVGARVYLEKEFAELFGSGRVFRNDIPLKPGRIVRGRVIDAGDRAPVRDAAVLYRPSPANPYVAGGDYWFHEPVLTDDQGEFKITAVEGPGVITVNMRSRDHIRTTIPADIAEAENPHAYAAIDVAAEGEIPALEIAVHRGVDLIVELVGPEGQSVPVVQIAYREADVPATHSLRSQIMYTPLRLRGCGPGKTYRLLIGTPPECEWGAMVDVVCNPASGPVKVSLQPTGSVRGKLVYADGTPASDVHTFPHFGYDVATAIMGTEPVDNQPFYNNVMSYKPGSRTTTDATGEFEILGIVPGVHLYLNVNYKFASGEQPGGVIEAGKTLDLGQLMIKP